MHKIFKMLLRKGLSTERIIELISSWRHTGFSVYSGKRINPKDARSTENLARYIIRASFSQDRMKYYPDRPMVTYGSKYGKDVAEFDPLSMDGSPGITYTGQRGTDSSLLRSI